MVRLTPSDISSLSCFNNSVFLSGSNETRVQTLERNVGDTRRELMRLMRELDLAKQQPVVAPLSETALRDFFQAHPSMSISYDDGKITLMSKNQSVAFHTMRERNVVAENSDIIYVTLPLYSIKLVFYPDGTMVGSAEKSDTLEEVWGASRLHYGHPHTTHRGANRAFESVCNGNNRFIQDWSAMRNSGVMDGNNTMRILSQAAIWMETANISDMYGTSLANGPHVPEDIVDGIDVDGLFHNRLPISETPPTLRFIFDSYGHRAYRMALWPLWMVRHFYSLPDCLTRCNSMYQAALYDSWIILKTPESFGAMYSEANAEIIRVMPIILRCYSELGGYYPDYGRMERTAARRLPELFPTNSNPNMEASYVTSDTATRATRQAGARGVIYTNHDLETV